MCLANFAKALGEFLSLIRIILVYLEIWGLRRTFLQKVVLQIKYFCSVLPFFRVGEEGGGGKGE